MNFPLKYHLYDQYATVQQQVAHHLLNYLPNNKPQQILEIGCGTGIFTKLIQQKYPQAKITANDLFDTAQYLNTIPQVQFIQGNIENLELDHYQLILSSSVFQWISDLDKLFAKLQKSSQNLIFSIYIQGNLQEIKDHFGNSLQYKTPQQITNILKKHYTNINYQTETIKLNFQSPREALRHLKNTGVTGEQFQTPSIQQLRSFKATTLTYEVAYFCCTNKEE